MMKRFEKYIENNVKSADEKAMTQPWTLLQKTRSIKILSAARQGPGREANRCVTRPRKSRSSMETEHSPPRPWQTAPPPPPVASVSPRISAAKYRGEGDDAALGVAVVLLGQRVFPP